MKNGIYTVANDVVYDQLVAFLNSVEVNTEEALHVCVIPYNHEIQRISEEIESRPRVFLFEDATVLDTWIDFYESAWATAGRTMDFWAEKYGVRQVHRGECHLRYAAFDERSPFDRFIYFDSDVLVLDSVQPFFDALDNHEFVTYDFQRKQPWHVFRTKSELYPKLFSEDRIGKEIFCSGCFGGHRGLFGPDVRDQLIEHLASGESDILYPNAPDQTLLNYMVMRAGLDAVNLSLTMQDSTVTGNAVTSRHFERQGSKLLDHGKPVIYLHYIGVPNERFRRLCAGEEVEIPYSDLFLHYRNLADAQFRHRIG